MCSIRIVDNKNAKRKENIGQDGLLPMVLPESGVGASGDDVGPPVAHARVQPAHAVAAHLQPNAINYFLIFLYHLLTEIKQISYFMYTLLPKHASHPRVASVHSTCVVESGGLGDAHSVMCLDCVSMSTMDTSLLPPTADTTHATHAGACMAGGMGVRVRGGDISRIYTIVM